MNRELRRLTAAGLVRATGPSGAREYEAKTDDPVVRDLARFVGQTRGRVPRIRRALEALRSPVLAFAVRKRRVAATEAPLGIHRGELDLIVLANAPKALIRVQLAGVGDGVTVHPMTIREWLARLRKGDVFVRRARRSRKLWLLGSWDQLVERERAQLESTRTLEAAMSDWREELSDEWDEAWDPFSEVARDAR